MEFTLPLSSIDVATSATYSNWQHMKHRFKQHLLMKHTQQKLSNSGAASLLMFINGHQIRDIMKSFSSGADENIDILDHVFENIEDLCLPNFILLYERFKFFSLRQKRFEDMRKFISEVKIFADLCELQEHQQKYVTDRIVEGVYSESLRKYLKTVSHLDLDTALEICEQAHTEIEICEQEHTDTALEICEKIHTNTELKICEKTHTDTALEICEKTHTDIALEICEQAHTDTSLEICEQGHTDIALEICEKTHTDTALEICEQAHTDTALEICEKTHTDTALEICEQAHTDTALEICEQAHTDTALEICEKTHTDTALEICEQAHTDTALEICEQAHTDTALEICEKSDTIQKCNDATRAEMSGQREVFTCKPHIGNGKRRIVNGKNNVSRKNSSVREKKSHVRKKRGRQNCVSSDDLLQQTGQMDTRSRRLMRTTNVAIAVDAHAESGSGQTSPSSTCTLRKLPQTCLTKHTRSVQTLPHRHTTKHESLLCVHKTLPHRHATKPECLLCVHSGESLDVETRTAEQEVMSCVSDTLPPIVDTSQLLESKERPKQDKHGLDSACCHSVNAIRDNHSVSTIRDNHSVSTIRDNHFNENKQDAVRNSRLDYLVDVKSETEILNACQEQIDEMKDSRQITKCMVYGQGSDMCCKSDCQLRNTVDKCHVCDFDLTCSHSLSRHMKQTHRDVLTLDCSVSEVLIGCQGAVNQHTSSHSQTEENFTCTDCGVLINSSTKYYQHRRKEHKDLICGCHKCGLTFPYPSKLKLHMMNKHNATKPFMCEICGSSFAEKNMLTTHKNIHTGEKKYECPTCGRRFLLKTTLSNHMQTHLVHRPHTCNVCGMAFKLSYYLKSHMKTHCDNRQRPHICCKCGAAFLKLAQLKNHERKHTGEKPYACNICSSQFSQLSSMNKHMKQIHEGVKPKDRFSCEFCGLSFTHSCKLKLHLMKHTGERPFACHFCGCTYREKHQLNTHMKIHSGSEPFQCPFCTQRFLQKSSLEGHVRKHTGEKPFQCPVCFQKFSHKSYLRDHVKVHDENRVRKYKCSICEKAFTCSSHMRSHEKLHSGHKPHKCDVCGSRFTKRSSVKKHLNRTHGIKDTPALQVQNCNIVSAVSQDTPAIQVQNCNIVSAVSQDVETGMILPHMRDQVEQQTDVQPGIQHLTQLDSQTDRCVELRPVESAEMNLQLHSNLHLSHMHSLITPEALPAMHSQPQRGICAGLHTDHSSLQHQINSHPRFQILHPGLHTTVHLQQESQMIACVTANMNTPVSQSQQIQEMFVYTMAT